MISVIEVGNTCLKSAVYIDGRIQKFQRIPLQDAIEEATEIGNSVDTVILASSGSVETLALLVEVFTASGVDVIQLEKNAPAPFRSRYAKGQAGIDRLANVAGCIAEGLFPVVIVDAGSAVTIDVVDSEAEYLGGIIMPGVRMQGQALKSGTATLPHVSLFDSAPPLIGTNTNEAIQAGILYGTCGAIIYIYTMASEHIGTNCPLILTGGDAELLSRFISALEYTVDEHLTLRGLVQIALHQNPELAP